MLSAFLNRLNQLTGNYVRWVIAHRYWVAFISIAVTLALCLQTQNLRVESNYKYFYSGDNEQLLAFNDLEETFTKSDNTIVAIQPKNGSIATAEMLQLVHEITEKLWLMPNTSRVDSIANYQYIRAEGDDIIVGDLIESPELLTDARAQEIVALADSKPELHNRLINVSGNTLGIIARAEIQLGDNKALDESARYAFDLRDEILERYPDMNVVVTGFVPRGYLFSVLPTRDMSVLVPLILGLLIVVMWLLTRSIVSPLITIGLVVLSSGAAMGIGALLGIPITTISSSAPVIILTVAVADSIHVLMSYLILLGKGVERNAAIVESMETNAQPILLTTLTTAIGFLSLNFSVSPPYQDLGNFAAFGTVLAWLLSMTYLPAMLAIVPVKPTPWINKQVNGIGVLSDVFIKYKAPGLGLVLVGVLAALFALPKLEFNEEYSTFFAEDVGENQNLRFVSEHLVGPFQVNYKLPAAAADGIYDPNYLNKIEALTQWLERQPEVSQVYSINTVFKNLNRSMHEDDDAYYKIPESKELAAQYLLLYELSLPYGLNIDDQISLDKSSTRVDVSTHELRTKEFVGMSLRIDEWMRDNFPESMRAHGTSITVLFAQVGISNFESMKLATVMAFVMISVCIGLSLASVRLGILSLILNVIPFVFVFVFGFLAFKGQDLAVWTVFMVPTALGLIVDATVHFLSKYQYARSTLAYETSASIHYSFTRVGMALWVSTMVLVLGFLTLYSASVQTLQLLGLGTAVAILLALLVDFMALPALLTISEKWFGPSTKNT